MVFDELGKFKKMEDPEERQPQELVRKKGRAPKTKIEKTKGAAKTVSLQTTRWTSVIVTLLLWITFLAGISLVLYKVLGAYTN